MLIRKKTGPKPGPPKMALTIRLNSHHLALLERRRKEGHGKSLNDTARIIVETVLDESGDKGGDKCK